ncbi:hypothetical protein GALL_299560 [mine drainage metagenome]|uniref:Uncharacterized protein n=1 Tax=mine drainage metagenome TaxID=410659 RepID=A0A1J5QX84_9ZZZZ
MRFDILQVSHHLKTIHARHLQVKQNQIETIILI